MESPKFRSALLDAGRSSAEYLALLKADESVWVVDPISGAQYKLLMVNPSEGSWVSQMRFSKGARVDRHYHSGSITAFTLAGSWGYPELKSVSRAGDILFERAGAVHSLEVLGSDGAEVLFLVNGSICYIDENGSVIAVEDWRTILSEYKELADAQGHRPRVLGEPLA